ncbi:MAG: NUDIX domain-containing protein [Patescibacteria group bacterium UBA2163]
MPRVVIVNTHCHPITAKRKEDIAAGDLFCAVALWATNAQGDVLIAQRSLQENRDPGCWGPAVHGIVEENESFLDTILRETQEEIGVTLDPAKLTTGERLAMHGTENEYFLQWYHYQLAEYENNFTLNEEETQKVEWLPKEEVIKRFEANPAEFVFSTPQWIAKVCV